MSRIKDLLAEQEDIDDLKPVKSAKEVVIDKVLESAICNSTKDEISNRAEYGWGESDEGETEVYVENFLDICGEVAAEKLDEYIEREHIDLTDTDYFGIIDVVRDRLADRYADYESELCEEVLSDDKYKLDDLAERQGKC